jgi:hypothetical protein
MLPVFRKSVLLLFSGSDYSKNFFSHEERRSTLRILIIVVHNLACPSDIVALGDRLLHPQGSAITGDFHSPVFVLYTARINITYSAFPLRMFLWISHLCQNKPRRFAVVINWQVFILIRSNKTQEYTCIYLLQIYSTCFGCPSHPSSGVHKTVTGTGHSIWARIFLRRGLIRPRWRKVVAL